MSRPLTAAQHALLAGLVGETALREDAAAVERSFGDLCDGMDALRSEFDRLRGDAAEGSNADG
ncbi:hypothetical protein ACQCSX_02720 [Pseudarthrobacter sp. P1]|uniref:hypothetical protein n=1 Tax=Pseudarthrobacter sp. P1 TaxID=3418418 RepID=UPI003CF2C671